MKYPILTSIALSLAVFATGCVSNKKYHHLLFNNDILAVDLSQNFQSLKSYAAIIRSFSRGKGFFTDSDALKTFLFGDDDQKQLLAKYQEEVQNIMQITNSISACWRKLP